MSVLKRSVVIILLSLVAFAAYGYNYGEALQKAIYFYECQQSGVLPTWNRVEWRGPSCLKDSVQGGWYDAGDHVKFGLPMAYTASVLGWGAYEYKAALTASGQWTAYANNLAFVLDYFVSCHQGSTLVYQIGDGTADHSWWGPVEVIEKKPIPSVRPTYTTTASCVTGQTAAALAIGSIVLGNSTYLTHAKALFTIADTTLSDATYTAADGFYNSWSGFYDELVWSATWLYIATNDASYLAKAEGYVANLNKQGQTTDIEYQWGHCWDDSHYGALLLLARITGKAIYKDFIIMHLDWWAAGAKGFTPSGLAWLDSWGANRYATTAAFLAFVYSDWTGGDAVKRTAYKAFAEKQLNYVLGTNERNGSYVVGYGTNPPLHPHHRTAHGSWADSQTVPLNHRHTIYGALVGGPDQTGAYTDTISNYVNNEIACDYNAGFAASLIKMYSLYGGAALTSFPAAETKDDEFYAEASLNSTGPTYTEVKVLANNHSGWPARFVANLSFNVYFDLTEVFAAGATLANITAKVNYVEFPVTISAITQYSGNIYYVKTTFTDGTSIFPGGQSENSGEVQLRISAPDGTSYWSAANDYSFKALTTTITKTTTITMYDGTTLIWGVEPGGTTPTPPIATATATTVTRTATATTVTRTATATTVTRTATATTVTGTATATTVTRTATATTVTRTATATRTATTRTATPTRTSTTITRTATATTVTRTATATTVTRTATATGPTPTPVAGCSCAVGCSTITSITPNFSKDGAGQFAYSATSLGNYINSWNLTLLSVNGVNFTNLWAAKASLPAAIGGLYYVCYDSAVAYGHFEAMN